MTDIPVGAAAEYMTVENESHEVDMNRRAILMLGVLLGVLAMLCFGHFFGTRKHETGDSPLTFRIAPFDERSKVFYLEREAEWSSTEHKFSAFSNLMRATGLNPSVRCLTNLLTSPTPEYLRWKLYWWLFPRKATVANALAVLKETYLEMAALDNINAKPTLLVSNDGHLGLLWQGTDEVMVFEDVTNGLQQTLYRKKANR